MSVQNIYFISQKIYYDSFLKCYKKILIVDREPEGELKNKIKLLNNTKLSPFQENTSYKQSCNLYAIYNINETNSLLDIDNQSKLISFLLNNNYSIETDLTKLLIENNTQKNILYAIKYNS